MSVMSGQEVAYTADSYLSTCCSEGGWAAVIPDSDMHTRLPQDLPRCGMQLAVRCLC